jgi:hypothetical protein
MPRHRENVGQAGTNLGPRRVACKCQEEQERKVDRTRERRLRRKGRNETLTENDVTGRYADVTSQQGFFFSRDKIIFPLDRKARYPAQGNIFQKLIGFSLPLIILIRI